jgi:hypothetical protein
MIRWLGGLGATLAITLVAARVVAQNRPPIEGAWKVVSYDIEFQDNGERRPSLGTRPNGYLIFGPQGRMMAYLEADGRKAPKTDAERAAAYRTLVAYTGKYRVQGKKWITKVDGAWNVEWIGTEQERSFNLNGDRLSVIAQWNPNPLYDGRMTRGHLTFEREK